MPDPLNISVRLHTILQKETSQGLVSRLDMQLLPGQNMAGLLEILQVELPPDALLLVVNGRLAELDYELKDGDAVSLMPALSGG